MKMHLNAITKMANALRDDHRIKSLPVSKGKNGLVAPNTYNLYDVPTCLHVVDHDTDIKLSELDHLIVLAYEDENGKAKHTDLATNIGNTHHNKVPRSEVGSIDVDTLIIRDEPT